jgi:hypothetical protein
MRRYEYCYQWSFARKVPMAELTCDEARARFDGRRKEPDDWFSVVARAEEGSNAGAVDFVLEVTEHAGFINTFLCDEWGSIRYIYSFRREPAGMFLFCRTVYTYPEEPRQFLQHQWTTAETILFKLDGYMRRELDDASKPTVEEWEYHNVDMSDNWEAIPEFEQWDAIAKYRG